MSRDQPSERASDPLVRGIEAHEAGDAVTAEAAFREAAAAGDPVGACWLGRALTRTGDLDGAVEAYDQAAKVGHPEATLNLALLFAGMLDRPDEARRLFELAVERGDRRGMFDLGFFLWEQRDYRAAAAAFQKAADSGDPRGYLELGFLLADEGRQEDALAAFEEAAAHGVTEAWTQVWRLAVALRR